MNTEELQRYLEEADAKDFLYCLKEDLSSDNAKHYKMLAELYYNDKAHFNVLSAGCKAALLIYLSLGAK